MREKKERNLWVLANKVPEGNEEASILLWKLGDFLVEDHNIVSTCPDVTTFNTSFHRIISLWQLLKALCLQQNNNRMFYRLCATRCQVPDDPVQGPSTICPHHHKQRQSETQSETIWSVWANIWLWNNKFTCVLGPRGFSKPLMVFNFAHC